MTDGGVHPSLSAVLVRYLAGVGNNRMFIGLLRDQGGLAEHFGRGRGVSKYGCWYDRPGTHCLRGRTVEKSFSSRSFLSCTCRLLPHARYTRLRPSPARRSVSSPFSLPIIARLHVLPRQCAARRALVAQIGRNRSQAICLPKVLTFMLS